MTVVSTSLVCLEGIDGSGTSTQARRLGKRLERSGVRRRVIHFPDYRTPVGRLIKGFLLRKTSFEARAIRLLYAANRWERAAEIERVLTKGVIVILDRYSPSNIAYGVADGLDKKWLEDVETGLPQPSLTILIDLPSLEASKRKGKVKKLDRYEKNLEYMERVRRAYLRLAKEKRWKIVDGVRSRREIEEEVWAYIRKRLPRLVSESK